MALLPRTPSVSPIDAKAFVKPIREQVRKPDLTPYAVYGETIFPGFVQSLRGIRDHVQKVTTFANDLKRNLDRNGATLLAHDARLDRQAAEIELLKQAEPPFPIA